MCPRGPAFEFGDYLRTRVCRAINDTPTTCIAADTPPLQSVSQRASMSTSEPMRHSSHHFGAAVVANLTEQTRYGTTLCSGRYLMIHYCRLQPQEFDGGFPAGTISPVMAPALGPQVMRSRLIWCLSHWPCCPPRMSMGSSFGRRYLFTLTMIFTVGADVGLLCVRPPPRCASLNTCFDGCHAAGLGFLGWCLSCLVGDFVRQRLHA